MSAKKRLQDWWNSTHNFLTHSLTNTLPFTQNTSQRKNDVLGDAANDQYNFLTKNNKSNSSLSKMIINTGRFLLIFFKLLSNIIKDIYHSWIRSRWFLSKNGNLYNPSLRATVCLDRWKDYNDYNNSILQTAIEREKPSWLFVKDGVYYKGYATKRQAKMAAFQHYLGNGSFASNTTNTSASEDMDIEWYHKASEQGDANAQYKLGTMYEEGRGVEINTEVALYWCQKAADQGHDLARSWLRMNFIAITKEQTLNNIKELQKNGVYIADVAPNKAAGQGDENFQYRLNWMYEEELERYRDCFAQIAREMGASQKNSLGQEPMIPMCVKFESKQTVKERGARWCFETKTWFWSFKNAPTDIEPWLPYIYRPSLEGPYILPKLVPQNLWGINLRSLLSKEKWDELRKDTYKNYAYRCAVCGCKGETWPVECDEMWDYQENPYQPCRGTVVFSGLVALCPGCHAVKHYGKACVNGNERMALARMCYLNDLDKEEVGEIVREAFLMWEERSHMTWEFDFSLLERVFGIVISCDPIPPISLDESLAS